MRWPTVRFRRTAKATILAASNHQPHHQEAQMMQGPQLRFDCHDRPGPHARELAADGMTASGERSGFTPLEWLAIAIGQQEGIDARGGLIRLGARLRGVFGGPRVRRMAVDRLEVLSRAAASAELCGARLADEDVALFRRAGFSNGQLLLLLASLEQARPHGHEVLR
ncbi:hypothetical protein DD559_05140 [Sphingomonas pokkalii]|uniref:Uncharacterized protein n=2 Tax=Sphingomonas pokkalii TaxID=2175090 RepID=A0A2U0SBP4_9SPHN|nr:hypothetical protein DD559_05140 [Sphingomonas pokkalii]